MQSSACMFVLFLHAATSLFFHEPSSIDLETDVPITHPSASFGFSLGYQEGKRRKILIGCPRFDHTGRVFQCRLEDVKAAAAGAAKTTRCQSVTIDLDAMGVKYSRNFSENQDFYLGASIAATEDYFVTCAPLRTAFLDNGTFFGAYGICFYHNDEGTKPWSGPGREKYLDDFKNATSGETIKFSEDIYGGSGWTTLVDKVHDRIIIAKSFYPTDAFYGKISQPARAYESFVENSIIRKTPSRVSYGHAMTLGNYFDLNKNVTHYAITLSSPTAQGYVQLIDSTTMQKVGGNVGDFNVGSMFGAALASADVTGDGRAELLVGAPAHAEDQASWDRGALHIFTARNQMGDMDLFLRVIGDHDGARFGTTLAANDVDGDSHPEIMVSAPFENAGEGVLYVLSGYEVHEVSLKRGKASSVHVSSLKKSQKIFKKNYQTFGFSLLPISDFNDNGSDELLVGSPGNSKVTLYRGIPSITVTVTSRNSNTPNGQSALHGAAMFGDLPGVRLLARRGDVRLRSAAGLRPRAAAGHCDVVAYLTRLEDEGSVTQLSVKNRLNGNDAVFKSAAAASHVVDLATPGTQLADGTVEYCRDFSITTTTPCQVTTTVSLVEDIETKKEFSNAWVTLSAQSVLEKPTRLSCSCASEQNKYCSPELSAQLRWSGNDSSYRVGTSRSEAVAMVIHNGGSKACYSCLRVRVRGAPVDHLRCDYQKPTDQYECLLPSPFWGNTDKTIDLKLLMDVSNQDKQFLIEVKLSKNCNENEEITEVLTIPYIFHEDLIVIEGTSVNYSLSDIELQDRSQEKIIEEQIYTIVNNKSVTWKNVQLEINVKRQPFLLNMGVSVKPATKCVESYDSDYFYSQCSLTLSPNSRVELTVYVTIYKINLTNYLQDWQITIPSELTLELSSDITKRHKLSTIIMFQKEQTVAQNKTLIIVIAVVVGLIVLLIIALILYKVGFFKRKTKQELQDLKQKIRKQSIKRDRLASEMSQNQREGSHCDTDDLVIIEESPFDDPIPLEGTNAPAQDEKKTS